MIEILENKDAKIEGDDSKENKEKLEALTKAEERKKILEEALFETFIIISNSFIIILHSPPLEPIRLGQELLVSPLPSSQWIARADLRRQLALPFSSTSSSG